MIGEYDWMSIESESVGSNNPQYQRSSCGRLVRENDWDSTESHNIRQIPNIILSGGD